jgi:predicted small secreted protein
MMNPRTLRRVLLVSIALAVLGGCNTVSGVGKDLQSASENTSRAIDRALEDE